jgi:hypothetical protein|tara:strand:- start:285 stop:707 length:423 start_codon:yes stop_codon:yes gene_type:complete
METTIDSFDEFLERFYGNDKEGLKRAKNPIISDYQQRLIDGGWKFITNEIATNYHIGLDLPSEPLKVSLRRMKEDFETRICPGKRIQFFRPYNTSGERILRPSRDKFFRKDVVMVAVYAKDRERKTHFFDLFRTLWEKYG